MKQSVTLRFYLWHSPSIVVCTYRGRLVSDTLDNDSRGYSGSTSPSSPDRSHSPADIRGESRDLCKRLMRQEERDPFRWGHAGFKELYPDEFASSEEERNGEGKSESEKRKERKSHSRKRKREHKDKSETKRRKLKKSGEGKSETSSKKKRQKAKKKKRERRRDEEQESSASDSDSSSDSEVDEHDRIREKKRTSRHKRK